jgi:hypothetical protein
MDILMIVAGNGGLAIVFVEIQCGVESGLFRQQFPQPRFMFEGLFGLEPVLGQGLFVAKDVGFEA